MNFIPIQFCTEFLAANAYRLKLKHVTPWMDIFMSVQINDTV